MASDGMRATNLADCHLELVLGRGDGGGAQQQLVFVGARDAKFGSCSFQLLGGGRDFGLQLSAGPDVPQHPRRTAQEAIPELSREEYEVVSLEVLPFVREVAAAVEAGTDLGQLGLAVDRARPLWAAEGTEAFEVTFEDESLKGLLFTLLRLCGGPRPAPAGRPGAPRPDATAQEVAFHGRCAEPGWEMPRCVASTTEEARPGYQTLDGSEYMDSKETLVKKVRVLAALLRSSRAAVVYTGAGVSTASGIGDYASKAKGSVAPHMRSGASTGSRLELKPTYSHHVLAALEHKGLLHHWLQQNHDRLAQKAGFPQAKINEIHGAWGDDKNMVKMMTDTLREDLLEWMAQWCQTADLCIAMGTSLCGMNADQVAQACEERHRAGAAGQQGLVIINLQRTPMDGSSTLRIWGVLDDVLRILAKELGMAVPSKVCQARGNEWESKHPRCKYNTPKRTARDPL